MIDIFTGPTHQLYAMGGASVSVGHVNVIQSAPLIHQKDTVASSVSVIITIVITSMELCVVVSTVVTPVIVTNVITSVELCVAVSIIVTIAIVTITIVITLTKLFVAVISIYTVYIYIYAYIYVYIIFVYL